MATDDFIGRSNANLVVLDVSVVGSNGVSVASLDRDQFLVSEDGKPQTIKQFSAAEAPVSVGFVIDMSGSMHSKLESVRRATSAFLDVSNPGDEYFLIGFNDKAWIGLPAGIQFSRRGDDIRRALLSVRAEGRTALYDGVAPALEHVKLRKYERRVLVLMTDGKDTASSLRLADAMQYVRSSPVTLYTMGLFDEDDEISTRRVLKQLARISGGQFFEPLNATQIERDCAVIARDIRARYTLAYTPPEEAKSAIRKIKVDLVRESGSPKAFVRARSEYSVDPPVAK